MAMVTMPTIDLLTSCQYGCSRVRVSLFFFKGVLRKFLKMFGGPLDQPTYRKRLRPKPMTYDIQLPTVSPGVYGHLARPLDTDYHVRWLHYRQRLRETETLALDRESKRLWKEKAVAKYDKHTEKKVFKQHIAERFKEKVKVYEESIEDRRKKLKELLCREEEGFIRETIEAAQKGVDSKMQDMKEKAQRLKAQREAERQEIVNYRRMMQLMDDCKELRPVLCKRNLVDSKNTQLQQIKENEMRKEAERELDSMWYNIMTKEREAKIERETQDLLKKEKAMNETMEVWEKQIYGKELMKQEAAKVAAEDHLEMVELADQLRREQIEALDAKRRKRDKIAKELLDQITVQEKYMAQRKQEEDALNNALTRLAEEEVKKEKQKIQDTTSQAKRESLIYRQHLKQLEEERKKEDEQLNALLDEHKKMIMKKQEDAYCKLKKAKEDLLKNVLVGRAEQLEYKKREAENHLKMQQAENELRRMACETNERLQAESDRLQAEEVRLYREDLKQQIAYNNEKRRLEKEQLERELAEGIAEEERRRQHVLQIIHHRLEDQAFKHPFRIVLEQPTCPCPDPTITK